jgi:hypothetical protein
MSMLHPGHTARPRTCTAAAAAFLFAVLAMPASAGTTQVSGVAAFNNECQPPVGSPPGDPGDYPPIDLSGDLFGCWYTYVSASQFNPSGTYVEPTPWPSASSLRRTTREVFSATPDTGTQFVIVRETGASLTTHKDADSYEFDGATKPGE